jgi:hypothetical protein
MDLFLWLLLMQRYTLNHLYTGEKMSPDNFCGMCGSRLVNGDCRNCFSNNNALAEFEGEDE